MKNRFFLTNGETTKTIGLLDSDDPQVWNFFSNAPQRDQDQLFARVAAMYRAFNLTANTVARIPFALLKGEDEFDISGKWENKVGFLKRPKDVFRRNILSLMATNAAYVRRTSDAVGYKTRGLYPLVPYTITWHKDRFGEVDYLERRLPNGQKEQFDYPVDKDLIRIWRLDHTTEVLPSENTDALAITNNAGEVYFADMWIKHFFQRGGVKPTLIAMKGMVNKDTKEDQEKSWSDFLRGLGTRWRNNVARIFNAESLDVRPFGSGIDDLKDNKVYEGALANIAMGTGMPLALLLSNSANYATAQVEKSSWYENTIIPWCDLLTEEYNEQLFFPLGLRLEFRPEMTDPEQEDETNRSQAISVFADFLGKAPTFDLFVGMCETFGYELSDSLLSAAEAYYAEKDAKAEEMAKQAQKPPEGANTRPVEQNPAQSSMGADMGNQKPPAKAAWNPTLDEIEELRVWREVALRRFKKGDSLDFDYQPHYGGLPEAVTADIRARLAEPREWSADRIKTAFEIARIVADEPAHAEDPGILSLADAINNLAGKLNGTIQLPAST